MAQRVLATKFNCSQGYRNINLNDGNYYYAELSNDYKKKDFSALGDLSPRHKLKITYKGKSIIAQKGDVGAGGPRNPKIDLHTKVYQYLGFPQDDDEYVSIQDA